MPVHMEMKLLIMNSNARYKIRNGASGVLTILIILSGFHLYAQDTESPFKIIFVDLAMESPKIVSADRFDSAFSSREYKTWQPETEEESDSMNIYFKQFVRIKNQEVSVRVKFIYAVRGHNIEIYMNEAGVFTDGFYYFKNNNLYRYTLSHVLKR
jgi:hypothetical protein